MVSQPGGAPSPVKSSSSSLSMSMQAVDRILSDSSLDSVLKMERIEAALAQAISANSSGITCNTTACGMGMNGMTVTKQPKRTISSVSEVSQQPFLSPVNWTGYRCDAVSQTDPASLGGRVFKSAEAQTLSTGEIVITKVHCPPKPASMPTTPMRSLTNM
ncbi:unnamed protein product [Notodromas monacha]|uniref:Uncharacterized protein n=1 Tax=Notodromas monacha TaxID=399045 RepID=A0A7R9BCQ3_9CRUS|nr:unnamed protein product [Notodromas monacha]CAG0912866.1 unnamed protein product [Notodromas monacha]